MEESVNKVSADGGDKDIIYSKTIKAGKRIYYLDVKKNLKDDMFVAITESKKVPGRGKNQVAFEKHKIFLYKEDFDKFLHGITDVINYIKNCNNPCDYIEEDQDVDDLLKEIESFEEIKINLDF